MNVESLQSGRDVDGEGNVGSNDGHRMLDYNLFARSLCFRLLILWGHFIALVKGTNSTRVGSTRASPAVALIRYCGEPLNLGRESQNDACKGKGFKVVPKAVDFCTLWKEPRGLWESEGVETLGSENYTFYAVKHSIFDSFISLSEREKRVIRNTFVKS